MGLAGQMIAIILVGFGIGTLVEKKIPSPKHLIVAFTTLGFVCIAMYVVIKDIISAEN
jgi:F0F1-type ATP synthase assembly protein I